MPIENQDERFHDHMKRIGFVAAMWAAFELEINRGIWELTNVSQSSGACVTAHIGSIAARLRAYIALA